LESFDQFNTNSKHQNLEELKVLTIIPIKGKSLLMNGSPLLERVIHSAKCSKLVTDIVVSTDNLETASIAKDFGAEVPFIRPEELSEGYIDVFDVVEYTMNQLENKKRYYDVIVFLEEIYPFRQVEMIDNMILKLISEGYDTIIAGQSESRSIWVDNSGEMELLGSKENLSMPSSIKESKNIIGLLGLCCAMHSASVRNNMIFSSKVGIFNVIDSMSVVAIRNEEELKIASALDKNL
jgi:CMP-N-acetylneuraminic acid synthetase